MNERPRCLCFGWWNLHNFAHFDPAKISHKRWPKSQLEYEAKRDRILIALREAFGASSLDLLAVCEITREAANDLAARMTGDYRLALPVWSPMQDGFHVAVLFRAGIGFTTELPIIPDHEEDIRTGTRQMIPVHFKLPGHLIRFVACHWTAFDKPVSRLSRERLADVLKRDCYQFLKGAVR